VVHGGGGDVKTPGDSYLGILNPRRHVYLSVETQLSAGLALARETPLNHFSRKNLGYLYAVRMGATQIFDFDDDNELIDASLPEFTVSGAMPAHLRREGAAGSFGVFNPCATGFGAKEMWPRGFPLSLINSNVSCEWRVPTEQIELGAIQSMANHDPDVDALYRLAPRASQPLPYFFRAVKQPQVVGEAVYAPFNAQACVFTRRALWAMYLPTTVHGRVSDIWRSYVAQRIFWTIGLRLAFHTPWVTQVRNSHDYLSDYMSERPLYETSEELLRVLHEWSPPLAGRQHHADEHGLAQVPRLLEDLYINLYEYGFVELEDVTGVQLWLSDLTASGYFKAPHGHPPASQRNEANPRSELPTKAIDVEPAGLVR